MPEMVMIGCKMPSGVILDLDRYDSDPAHPTRPVRVILGPARVTLKGNRVPLGQPDPAVGGYVFTQVPADFWNEWVKRNVGSPLLADKLLLAPAKPGDAPALARDHAAVPAMFPAGPQRAQGVQPGTRD